MKKINSTKKLIGIGLIEVLVSTVVIALGLLSVASLQGELIGSSAESKTREEAKNICTTKVEQLRDSIENVRDADNNPIRGYALIASSAEAGETITGVNATYTRSWNIDDLPNLASVLPDEQVGPNRKRVQATCIWGGDAGEQVTVQSIIVFQDVGSALFAAIKGEGAGGEGGLPISSQSTNANSSDEINDPVNEPVADIEQFIADEGLENTIIKDEGNGNGSLFFICDELVPFDTDNVSDLYTRRVHYKPVGETFEEAIELFKDEEEVKGTYCKRKIRFNGGVIIPIRGTVHSRATDGNGQNVSVLGVDLFTFNATESGTFCVFEPAAGTYKAGYVCYIGGNCINGAAGDNPSYGQNSMECPSGDYPAHVYEEIGPGGWRGKVGLLGIPVEGRNVCFQEEILGSATTKDTARNYFTRRVKAGINSNEGINQAYSCHDFLIVNGKNTLAQLSGECVTRASLDNATTLNDGDDDSAPLNSQLESKTVSRGMTTEDNQFNPVIDNSFCSGVVVDDVDAAVAVAAADATQSALNVAVISDSTSATDANKSAAATLLADIVVAQSSMDTAYALGTVDGNVETIRLSNEIQAKAAEIAAILDSLGTIYEINGTIVNGTSSVIVTVENGACTQTASTYFCSVQTSGDVIVINAIDSAGSNVATTCSISDVSAVDTTPAGCDIVFPLFMSISNYSTCTAIGAPACSVKKAKDFNIQFFLNGNDSTFVVSINNETGSDAAIVGDPSLVSANWEQTITASGSSDETFSVTIAATKGAETVSKTIYFISANN